MDHHNLSDDERDGGYYYEEGDGDIPYSKLHVYNIAKQNRCPIDFNDLPIGTDVIEKCKVICRTLMEKTVSKRINRIKHLKFICVFFAYNDLEIVVQPEDIAIMVGITKKEMFKSIQTHSELETGYRPKNIRATPAALLERYCETLEMMDHKDDIIKMAKKILSKDPMIDDEKMPQVIAGGLLMYYLKINGITIKGEKIENTAASVSHKSAETIKSTCKRIYEIDNS